MSERGVQRLSSLASLGARSPRPRGRVPLSPLSSRPMRSCYSCCASVEGSARHRQRPQQRPRPPAHSRPPESSRASSRLPLSSSPAFHPHLGQGGHLHGGISGGRQGGVGGGGDGDGGDLSGEGEIWVRRPQRAAVGAVPGLGVAPLRAVWAVAGSSSTKAGGAWAAAPRAGRPHIAAFAPALGAAAHSPNPAPWPRWPWRPPRDGRRGRAQGPHGQGWRRGRGS